MEAATITSDTQFTQGPPDLVLDGAIAASAGLQEASGSVNLPMFGPMGIPRGMYYVRIRAECTGGNACPGPCSQPFPYHLWLSNAVPANASGPPEPGNTAANALDMDENCTGGDCQHPGAPVFIFPTMIGNPIPTGPTGFSRGADLIEIEETVAESPPAPDSTDEDWFRILVDEGEIINIWLAGGDCHPSDPVNPARLSVAWMTGPAGERAIYWASRPPWEVGENVVVLSEFVDAGGNATSMEFPRSTTLSFTNPAGHRDAEGQERPAPIWIRIRMEDIESIEHDGNRRCAYRLGIGRPGVMDSLADSTIVND